MPQPPIDHELNLATQAVLLYGSWILTAVLLVISARMSAKERTPFYFLMVLAVLVGAFVEPLYDTAFMLYFYSTQGMVTHFTAFGIPQPLWTHSGYVVLYATPAIFIAQAAWRGTLTSRRLYLFAGVEILMSCVFEMIGINGGGYAYWGPHVLRIAHYPVVIGVLEAAQTMMFAVAASLLRKRMARPVGLLALFLLFPCTFLGGNFGAGWPVIIPIHLENPSTALTLVGTLASIVFAALFIRAAAALVPLAAEGAAVPFLPASGGTGSPTGAVGAETVPRTSVQPG
jgi:hypothetical protein